MTQRLPIVGSDNNTWGSILNGFLSVSLNSDGTLNSTAVSTAGAEMTANKGAANGYAGLNANSVVPTAQLGSGTAGTGTYLSGNSAWVSLPTIAQLDTTATDIQPLGTQAAGSTGKAADAGHVHPTTGLITTANAMAVSGTASNGMILVATGTNTAAWLNAINSTATNIQPLGTQAAGSTGKAADAGHVHPTTGLVTTSSTAGGDATGTFSSLTVTKTNGTAFGTAATKNVDTTATDIQPLGTQASGSTGQVADAGHVHPNSIDSWHAMPAFATNYSHGTPAPAYRLNIDNTVSFAGDVVVTSGAAGATFVTLPTSTYFPISVKRFAVPISAGAPSTTANVQVTVDTSGGVTLSAPPTGATFSFALDCVRYPLDY